MIDRKLRSGCAAIRRMPQVSNLAVIVRAYVKNNRPRALEELARFEHDATLHAAVERAGMARRPDGKRYDHQRRIPCALLRIATSRLHRAPLAIARDFHSLFDMVQETIGPIDGIGELTVYDTALRIGAKLGLLPKRVYLHSGTRLGARAPGLDCTAPHLELDDCPAEFRVLKPHEVEDCLCIFKGQFVLAPNQKTRRASRYSAIGR
jgi:hypothetical protein